MTTLADLDITEFDELRKDNEFVKENASFEAFADSATFSAISEKLGKFSTGFKEGLSKLFQKEKLGTLTPRDADRIKAIVKFLSNPSYEKRITAKVDLTSKFVFVPRNMKLKVKNTVSFLENFSEAMPVKFLEEVKEANVAIGKLINEPSERTVTRVKDMLSPTLSSIVKDLKSANGEVKDPRVFSTDKEFFEAYDSFSEFKETSAKVLELTRSVFNEVPAKLDEELSVFSESVLHFNNVVASDEKVTMNPEVLKKLTQACDNLIDAAEFYAIALYRVKEVLYATSQTCDSFK